MKKFSLNFFDPKIEKEYDKLKDQNLSQNFYVNHIFLQLYIATVVIPSIVKDIWTGFYISIASVVGLLVICLLFKISNPFKRYASVLTLLVMYVFLFCRFFFFQNTFSMTKGGVLFFRGYGYASIEYCLILQFFHYKHQVVGVIIGLMLKIGIVGWLDQSILNVDGLFRYFIVDFFLLYTFYAYAKRERQVFKSFYEYREGLNKFKQLLTDYLPQSVTVLDLEGTHAYFSNKTFLELFEDPNKKTSAKTDSGISITENKSPEIQSKINLNSLYVEAKTIREIGSEDISKELLEGTVTLKEIIKKIEKYNPLFEGAWTFCASYSQNISRKLFEIILKKIKWDQDDAVAVIFNDITHQENLIALKVADENKNKILGTVSHELRTPLNVIIGILQICEKKIEKDSETLDLLTLCKDNAYLLLSLVNSILDLQRIGQGKFTLIPSQIEVKKLLNDIIRLFQFQAKRNEINLSLKFSDGLTENIYSDEDRIKQILINLLGNAFKFTFKGSITVEVSEDPTNSNFLLFSVIDTGIGIKEEDKDKLFKMYGKLEDKEGVNKNGVGLGLTIANSLSAALGGKLDGRGIELESKFGIGSKFSFHILKNLPPVADEKKELDRCTVTKSDDNGLQTHQTLGEAENITENDFEELMPFANSRARMKKYTIVKKSIKEFESQNTIRDSLIIEMKKGDQGHSVATIGEGLENINNNILIVDDNPFNLLVAESLLKDMGFKTQTAREGKEAIQIVKDAAQENLSFRAILMDCQMPVMDGYEASSILKKMMKKRKIKKTTIIALTANTGQRDIERCFECGMDDFLSKPLLKRELYDILQRVE